MLLSSAESTSSSIGSPTVSEVVRSESNDRQRRSSSPSSDEEGTEAETMVQTEDRQQKRQSPDGSGVNGGGGGGKLTSRKKSSCGVCIGDSGVRQIMEPALRQLEAVCAEIGAPFNRDLAANFETWAVIKSEVAVLEHQPQRLHSVLSVRVDLCQRLFLGCLAGLAGLLGLDADRTDPDPALADAFAAVRRSAERIAGRLGTSLLRALPQHTPSRSSVEAPSADSADTADFAWPKVEAALDVPILAEAFGLAADRAAWRRLRLRRLRRSGWPGEPAIFAQLTRRKALLTSVAGAAPKFHHAEAVRHLLMVMSARVVAEVEAAAAAGVSAAATR